MKLARKKKDGEGDNDDGTPEIEDGQPKKNNPGNIVIAVSFVDRDVSSQHKPSLAGMHRGSSLAGY